MPPPRQFLLGPERQLTLEGREEPLHTQAVPAAPASSPAGERHQAGQCREGGRRQQQLELGPYGSSKQLALALFPEERRNPRAGVVLDDLLAVVKDWQAFWAPLEEELEEVRKAGRYKYLESVKLLALGRWIHGLRHEAIEEEAPPRVGKDAGCPLQAPARGLVTVLQCKGSSPRARLRRAFRVLQELRERGEIRRHPRLVTLRWATRHRPPDMQIQEVPDLDGDGNEISRRRVDVHGVIYFRWKGVGFIQRRGDRYEYRVIARARSQRTVKVIAGANAAVLAQFSRQLRRVAKRLRRPPPGASPREACIPTLTSTPHRLLEISTPESGGAAAPRPPQSSELRSAHASMGAQSGAPPAPAPPHPAPAPHPRQTAQGSVPENKGAAPRAAGRGPARYPAHADEAARLDRLSEAERAAEMRALRAGWALPELREEVQRCWHNVEWVPYLDVRGRPVYLGNGDQRMRPEARPITTVERWRPIAWELTSEEGRDQLRRMFAPIAALLTVRIRRGDRPPAPSWTPPPKRRRGRFDSGLHAWGRGRCKKCERLGPLMYEADVKGQMVPLGYCERCWDAGRWAGGRSPRPATPAPVMRPAEASASLADVLRRTLGAAAAAGFAAKFKLNKKE